jgi:hypothetical protein
MTSLKQSLDSEKQKEKKEKKRRQNRKSREIKIKKKERRKRQSTPRTSIKNSIKFFSGNFKKLNLLLTAQYMNLICSKSRNYSVGASILSGAQKVT